METTSHTTFKTLAVITVICAAILLAGFGYFTSDNNDTH